MKCLEMRTLVLIFIVYDISIFINNLYDSQSDTKNDPIQIYQTKRSTAWQCLVFIKRKLGHAGHIFPNHLLCLRKFQYHEVSSLINSFVDIGNIGILSTIANRSSLVSNNTVLIIHLCFFLLGCDNHVYCLFSHAHYQPLFSKLSPILTTITH